jgi:MFS family permease
MLRDCRARQALFTLTAFLGVGLGPAMMGYVAQRLSWRWVEWITMMAAGVAFALTLLFLRETRGQLQIFFLQSKPRVGAENRWCPFVQGRSCCHGGRPNCESRRATNGINAGRTRSVLRSSR